MNSTSAASAVVAGVVALIRSRYPSLTVAEVRQALITSTTYRRAGGLADGSGYGAVNADQAMTAAAALAAPPCSSSIGRGPAAPGPGGGARAVGRAGHRGPDPARRRGIRRSTAPAPAPDRRLCGQRPSAAAAQASRPSPPSGRTGRGSRAIRSRRRRRGPDARSVRGAARCPGGEGARALPARTLRCLRRRALGKTACTKASFRPRPAPAVGISAAASAPPACPPTARRPRTAAADERRLAVARPGIARSEQARARVRRAAVGARGPHLTASCRGPPRRAGTAATSRSRRAGRGGSLRRRRRFAAAQQHLA